MDLDLLQAVDLHLLQVGTKVTAKETRPGICKKGEVGRVTKINAETVQVWWYLNPREWTHLLNEFPSKISVMQEDALSSGDPLNGLKVYRTVHMVSTPWDGDADPVNQAGALAAAALAKKKTNVLLKAAYAFDLNSELRKLSPASGTTESEQTKRRGELWWQVLRVVKATKGCVYFMCHKPSYEKGEGRGNMHGIRGCGQLAEISMAKGYGFDVGKNMMRVFFDEKNPGWFEIEEYPDFAAGDERSCEFNETVTHTFHL